MAALMIASVVTWIQHGNDTLRNNWNAGQPGSASGVARDIFNGICLGLLGVTGFECKRAHRACQVLVLGMTILL
jgi:hypothetical protein